MMQEFHFTEMQPMIQRGQATNVTEYVALDEALGDSNASLVELAEDSSSNQLGYRSVVTQWQCILTTERSSKKPGLILTTT